VTDPDAFGGQGGVIAVDPASGRQSVVTQGNLFRQLGGVTVLRDGTIVVSDQTAFEGTGGLIRIDPGTGQQAAIASSSVFLQPLGVAVDPGGELVVAYTARPGAVGTVMRVNPGNGQLNAVAADFAFVFPAFVALDAAGSVIVTEPDAAGAESRVERIDGAGHVNVLTVDRPQGAIYGGVVVEPGGGILVANIPNQSTGGVFRIDPTSGVPSAISQGENFEFRNRPVRDRAGGHRRCRRGGPRTGHHPCKSDDRRAERRFGRWAPIG
jgi:DNA-binding beta-propeller fold protein YncE